MEDYQEQLQIEFELDQEYRQEFAGWKVYSSIGSYTYDSPANESNWDTLQEMLEDLEESEDISIWYTGGGASYVVYKPTDENLKFFQEVETTLDSYPLLNDEDYSRRENEDAKQLLLGDVGGVFDDVFPYSDYELTEQDRENIITRFYDIGGNCYYEASDQCFNMFYEEETLQQAIRECFPNMKEGD